MKISYYIMHYHKYVDYYNEYAIKDKQFNTEEELKEFIKNNLNEKDKIRSITLVKKEIKKLDVNEYLK